jgi:EAL domain-containing protein (putative c-di-GMP-specific phosphodiesterase class I)
MVATKRESQSTEHTLREARHVMHATAVNYKGTHAEKLSPWLDGWFLAGHLGDQSGLTQIPIGKIPFTIGRSTGADFCLNSKSVSKAHAEIIAAVDAVLVRDLGSTNGTFVNGHRIIDPTPVGEDDLLQFADMEFRLGRDLSGTGEHTAVGDCIEDGWLISRLHEVINHRKFTMAYQSIVDNRHFQPVAYEALVRCELPGLESPLKLFEAASRIGVEERVSSLCRQQAVETLASHPAQGKLFLNTHPNEFLGPELVRTLADLRLKAGARQLVLEIHEAAVPDLGTMREFRDALRDLGIGLAYDDFGAGQSRLLELTKIPPDYLKFDRSLLKDIATASSSHHALVLALLRHAQEAGIATVAEGLDSRDDVDVCLEMGFSHFQGYYFSRPIPAEGLK